MAGSAALSQARDLYNAGKKQELLAPAAAYALEEQDIQLLESLKKANWDASLIMGQMPADGIFYPYTPLTYSALLLSSKSLSWLIYKCDLSLEDRDGNLRRAIDVILERDPTLYGEVLNVVKRDMEPVEADALEELASNVYGKFSNSKNKLATVNGESPGKLWKNFDAHLQKMEFILSQRRTLEQRGRGGYGNNVVKAKNLHVKWKSIGEHIYEYTIVSSTGDWGSGGISGKIYFRYGYWLTKDQESWDS